jgi:pyruvate kinase
MKNTLVQLRTAVGGIYQKMKNAEQQARNVIAQTHPNQQKSITNLIHYLALRREDLRPLQDHLHDAGLSSLASAESHILRQVQAVLQRLGAEIPTKEISGSYASTGSELLHQRAFSLFGSKEDSVMPHLMVTFETDLANNYPKVKALLKAGMNIARINCAHDSPEEWIGMIANVHKATLVTGRPCKIYLDLAGPKIRTVLLGKGRRKGRLKLKEQECCFLAESNAEFDKKEKVIGCTLPGVVKDLQQGNRVLFDDGLFEAIVEIPGEHVARIRITRISAAKPVLKPEKGINFPETELSVRSLTEYDKSLLPFAQAHADLLGFSFVRTAADVAELQELLQKSAGKKIPLVLKIETFEAVQNLPDLLLQGMKE